MQFTFFCFLLALPVIALACEGECITGTTNELVKLWSLVVARLLKASEAQFLSYTGLRSSKDKDLDYFEPFFTAFKNDAPAMFEKDIFPGYFHGKCQRHGVEPEGCPNPDCPVVCGTPGSMCHHYPQLRSIAFNSTRNITLSFPDSGPYQQVLQRVEAASPPRSRARSFRFARSSFYPSSSERSISTAGFLKQHSRSVDMEYYLQRCIGRLPTMLLEACNGPNKLNDGGDEKEGNLMYCSWEKHMKAFILQYP